MLLKILKKDMFRKKVMNFILFLFILLATLFVATGISNVVTVLNGTNYYFDRAGIGDYLVLVQGEDAVRELDHYLKTQASRSSPKAGWMNTTGSGRKPSKPTWRR